jgi:hypothetical protein
VTSTATNRLRLAYLIGVDRLWVETVAYAIGGLLMLSGVFHVVVFLIDDSPWQGRRRSGSPSATP